VVRIYRPSRGARRRRRSRIRAVTVLLVGTRASLCISWQNRAQTRALVECPPFPSAPPLRPASSVASPVPAAPGSSRTPPSSSPPPPPPSWYVRSTPTYAWLTCIVQHAYVCRPSLLYIHWISRLIQQLKTEHYTSFSEFYFRDGTISRHRHSCMTLLGARVMGLHAMQPKVVAHISTTIKNARGRLPSWFCLPLIYTVRSSSTTPAPAAPSVRRASPAGCPPTRPSPHPSQLQPTPPQSTSLSPSLCCRT
jgi:hypothetical protein